jgi:hypothetical protein
MIVVWMTITEDGRKEKRAQTSGRGRQQSTVLARAVWR